MAVFEANNRFQYIPVPYNTPANSDQFEDLKKLQEQAADHPKELLLVRSADIHRRPGNGPMPSTANLSWREYLGIIPAEDPASVLRTDRRSLEIHPEKFATFEEVRQGKPRVILSTDPIGHMWHKRIDLGALNAPAQEYTGGYLVERHEVRQDPVLEVHVGDEAVKDYMLTQANKATERAATRAKKWWAAEIDADNLLIGYYRLQSVLERVVLPLNPHLERLMKLQGSNPDQRKRFVEELIIMVKYQPHASDDLENTLKDDIIANAKVAVLGGLCSDTSMYSDPLLPGIEGVNRTVNVDKVIRSICQKYGVEAPPQDPIGKSDRPKFD